MSGCQRSAAWTMGASSIYPIRPGPCDPLGCYSKNIDPLGSGNSLLNTHQVHERTLLGSRRPQRRLQGTPSSGPLHGDFSPTSSAPTARIHLKDIVLIVDTHFRKLNGQSFARVLHLILIKDIHTVVRTVSPLDTIRINRTLS